MQDANTLDFRILGTLQVCDAGRDVRVSGGKLRSLLGILLVHANQPVSEDLLIEGLWGGAATARAAGNLHVLVSRLRRALGSDRILREGNGYLLRVEPGELDLDRFEALRADGEAAEALELWRGPALADFVYEPWAQCEARRLEELRAVALEERIENDLAAGRHTELVGELQALVEEHPLRETLRRHLIVALYRSGRQAEALEAYRTARLMLDEELGLEPSPELRELERAILRHDPSLEAPPKARLVAAALRTRRRRAVATVPLAILAGFAAAFLTIHLLDGGQRAVTVAAAATQPARTVELRGSVPRTGTQRVVIIRNRARPAPRRERLKRVSVTIRTLASAPQRVAPKARVRVAHPAKAKPRRRVTVTVPNVYWLSDDFDDPAFDFGLWHIATHGDGVGVGERNGRLEFSTASEVAAEGDYGVDQHYGTGCRLTGDFDARVDFELLDWPERDGVALTFGVYFPPPDEKFWSISRQGRPATGGIEGYAASVASISRATPATSVKGALRLRRVHNVLTMYYAEAGHWTELAGGYSRGAANLILGMSTNPDQFGGQAARAAFDNFEATSSGVDCGAYPLPPSKPRR